jgi:hypothetical protein
VVKLAARWHPRSSSTSPDACGSIRLKLLKIGALVCGSVRRISVAMASAFPWQHEFALAHAILQ